MAKKQKKYLVFDIISIILIVLQVVLIFIDFSKLIKTIVLSILFLLVLMILIINLKQHRLLVAKKQKEIDEIKKRKQEVSLIEIYGILGISPQYNQDGSLKTIFELLGIEPQYDENGNRLPTIYEILGVNPKFSKDGVEIPLVFRIKNRINAVVKTQQSIPLFYVSKERKMIDERYLPLPVPFESPKDKDQTSIKSQLVVVKTQNKKSAPKKPGKKPNYGSGVWAPPKGLKSLSKDPKVVFNAGLSKGVKPTIVEKFTQPSSGGQVPKQENSKQIQLPPKVEQAIKKPEPKVQQPAEKNQDQIDLSKMVVFVDSKGEENLVSDNNFGRSVGETNNSSSGVNKNIFYANENEQNYNIRLEPPINNLQKNGLNNFESGVYKNQKDNEENKTPEL